LDEKEYFDTLARIVKGAEFIETIKEDDPRRAKAFERYDQLCTGLIHFNKTDYFGLSVNEN